VIFSSPKSFRHSVGPNGYRDPSPGVNRQGREVHHSPPSTAEVKNEWSYTSTPPVYLHGLDTASITFYFSSTRLKL
jgi:hypothetical protein